MNSGKIRRQFGLWDSAITPLSLARGMDFADVAWGQDGSLVWLEGRSDRGVLVVQPPDAQAPRDLNSEFSVRARVGYGGGDFTVGDGQVYFVEAESGRIYRQPLASGIVKPVTPAFGNAASPALSPDGKWLLFVHSYEDQDAISVVDSAGEFWPQKLVSGDDFYMQPTWHPDGTRVAWIAWNHPNMPWDGTALRMGKLRLDQATLPTLEDSTTIAGNGNSSIFQPQFSPDGRFLAYVSDASGWWQIYLYDLVSEEHRQLTTVPAEHGNPAWIQGMRTYAFDLDRERLFFLRNQEGIISLWQADLNSGEEQRLPLDEDYTYLAQISASSNGLALIASGNRLPARIITYRLEEDRWNGEGQHDSIRVRQRATSEELPLEAYSSSRVIQWQGTDGGTVHGLFYPPHNPDFEGLGKPPLIVNIHGGPTSQIVARFNPRAQFFISRGYAVLEVNHRGSTGYGRAYRDMLRESWGIYDVQDAVSGAEHLASQGLIDEARVVIMGGSAGGFTVLKALEDHPGFFKAGICLYGVSNQFTLASETHKFEKHYLDTLLGSLPEAADVYRERSPIFFVEKIQDAIAIFQGEEDVVVPHKQSDEVVDALRRQGVPHVYHLYPGEGHGFRKTETIEHLYQTIREFLIQQVVLA